METEAPTTIAANAGPATGALILILFAAAACQVWQFWRHRRIEVTTLLWQAPFVGLLGFIIYWTGQGFVEDWTADTGNTSATTNLAWAAGICGLVPLLRGPLARLIDATKAPMRLLACILRDAVCILVAATLSFRALEVAWNNNVDLLPWSSVTFSVALIAAFMAVAYFAFLRRGAGPALAAVACAGVGIAQSFICAFKGVAILPSDLLVLGTAAAVSAGYDYVLTPAMLDAPGLLCIALAILSLIRPPKLPVGGNMSTEASSVDMPKDLKAGSNAREDSSTTDAARPSLRMTIGSLINRDACPSSNTAMGAHTALGSHPSLESSTRSALTLASRRRWNIVAATASVVLAVVCGNSIQGWFNNNQVTDALEISFDH